MDVSVVTLIVPMRVGVSHGFMTMDMAVPILEEEENTQGLQRKGCPVIRGQGFVQPNEGDHQTEQGRGCEYHLAAGGSKILGGRDVENDAGSISQCSREEGQKNRARGSHR